jgi:hypothetical protein
MIRRPVPFVVLAFCLALCCGLAGSARAAQTFVSASAWVDLGPAPLRVTPQQNSVYLFQGASAPSSPSGATLIGGSPAAAAQTMDFYGIAHVFALAAPGTTEPIAVEADLIVPAPIVFPTSVAVTWSGQSVGLSGTLPAFAATPTFNIGTAPTIAVTGTFWPTTQPVSWSGQSVGLSGTLPAFAATPTINLGTLNGAAQDGADATGVTAPTGGVGIRGWLSGIYSKLSSMLTSLGSPFQAGGAIGNTAFTATTSAALTNPTSTLTLTSATTAYGAGQLIANNATAASVVVPSFSIANSGGGALIPRLRLSVNDATSTAWGAVSIQVDLWSQAPTFSNGDRGAWSPATGTATHLGAYACTMSAEYGDGAFAECAPAVGSVSAPKLASGASVYWTLQAVAASGVTGASKVWTLTAELAN